MTQFPHVLVIEDDGDVQQLLGSHLRRLGCEVVMASTGEQGVALAVAAPPDVVVVDVMLPGMDGRAVVRALRTDPATSGARIVVTTVLDPDDLPELRAYPLLRKPFSRQDVYRVLASLDRILPDATATSA